MQTNTPIATRGKAAHRVLWTLQILLAGFFLVAAAGPKLVGETYAVTLFTEIGAGQWLRYLVGVVELVGAVGLLVPRLAGAAALGLVATMGGAIFTQLVILGTPLMALTPALLCVLLAVIAWVRRAEIRDLVGTATRGTAPPSSPRPRSAA